MTRRSPSQASSQPLHRPAPARRRPLPGYPLPAQTPLDESPALSPEQIPVTDNDERALPSDVEAAEALGVGAHELSEEIREEERQRHPGAQGDVEHAAGLTALADEFDRRMAEGSR